MSQDEALMCELDASVDFGSGFLCVVGPPSSGKTSLVLEYLVRREQRFYRANADLSVPSRPLAVPHQESSPQQPETPAKTYLMEYWTARSFSGDALAQMAHRLQVDDTSIVSGGGRSPLRRRRRVAYDTTPLEFGYSVTQWLEAHAPGSELHLVVDDADALDREAESVNAWLSSCLNTSAALDKLVCVWLVSQLPLRLSHCYRFHFVSPLDVDAVCAWLAKEQHIHAQRIQQEEEQERRDLDRTTTDDVVLALEDNADAVYAKERRQYLLSAEAASECVAKAVKYYATHQPMCASVVCKDVRLLLRRVYQLLPALVMLGGTAGGTNGCGSDVNVALNAIHYSAAWGRLKDVAATESGTRDGAAGMEDPLVLALEKIGYSAVLLAFAAFYSGAVPRRKQFEVFHGAPSASDPPQRANLPKSDAHGQSHKAAVLSAASQVITLPRLLHLYDAILGMCVERMDPMEFASAEVAAHHIHGFVAWGLMTPVVSQRSRKKYHCWIPVSTAVRLGKVLGLNLFDLIPS